MGSLPTSQLPEEHEEVHHSDRVVLEGDVSISHMLKIKDGLLSDCRTYPSVVYGLASEAGSR